MEIRLKRALDRMSGGLVIVPLALGSVVTTVSPHVAKTFGSFTGALFTGTAFGHLLGERPRIPRFVGDGSGRPTDRMV